MLPRVTAALAQLISPLTTSEKGLDSHREHGGHKHPESEKEKDERPLAQVIPLKKPEGVSVEPEGPPTDQLEPAADGTPGGVGNGIAGAFLQLIGLFQLRKGPMSKQAGSQTYQVANGGQKQGSKLRKGLMLDQKIE